MTKARDLSQVPNASLGFKNRIINGAMMIDQRNAGAAVTVDGARTYITDRFNVQDFSDAVLSAQQVSEAPAGFVNSLKVTVTTADSSLAATQGARVNQRIEGFNIADFAWGTASASPVTLSFWVRSSLTGTFGGSLQNETAARAYPFTYTISAANTWEYKTVTIAGDTTGTWNITNGIGVLINWGLGMGSTYSGTAGAWAAADLISVTGAVSVVGTLNATFQITGVQLEKGSTATSFDYRPYGTELALCQRYYQRYQATAAYTPILFQGRTRTTTGFTGVVTLPVVMRAAPTLTATNSSNAWYIATAGDLNANTIYMETSNPSVVALSLAVSGAVSGQGGTVYPVASGTYFDLSAEL